jgi:GT2 family glycosyltransferase
LKVPRIYLAASEVGFIPQTNLGLASPQRQGDILLLNDDTQVTSRAWLSEMEQLLHSAAEIGAVGAVSNYVGGLQHVQYSAELPLEHETNLLSGFCMLIKQEAFEKVGFLDPCFGDNMFEDFDYCIRLRDEGYQVWVQRKAFVWHYGSQTLLRERTPEAVERFNARLKAGEEVLVQKWGQPRWDVAQVLPQSLRTWIMEKSSAEVR